MSWLMTSLIAPLKILCEWLRFETFGAPAFGLSRKKMVSVTAPELSDCEVAGLRAAVLSALDKRNDYYWEDAEGADQRIFCFEETCAEASDVLHIKSRISEIERYLGRVIVDWCLMANRTTAVSGSLGSGGGFHRDSAFSHQIKIIWYLTHVSHYDGPFCYLEGSHHGLVGLKSPLKPPQTRLERSVNGEKEVTGPAGTMIVADTRGVHGGKPVEQGPRVALTLYTFFDKRAKALMLEQL